MASENDDFMPTGMRETKNEVSPAFNKDNTEQTNIQTEKVEIDVSDMIKEDQPHPELTPDFDGADDVRRDHFNQKWTQEYEKYDQQQQDAFYKVDLAQNNHLKEQSQSDSVQDAFSKIDHQHGVTHEQNSHKDIDAFEKIDQEKEWSDRLGQSQGKERS